MKNKPIPKITVPNLVIRQPLPSGTEIALKKDFDEFQNSVLSPLLQEVNDLREKVQEMTDITGIYDARMADLEANTIYTRGMIMTWASDAIPAGWLLCDNSEYLIAEYEALFNVIGNRFGGDGITTFKTPDLRGMFVRGSDGNLGETKDDTTRAPRNTDDIDTGIEDASLSHKHGIEIGDGAGELKEAGAHSHNVSGNTANEDAHKHNLGDQGTPITAFKYDDMPEPIPYDSHYDALTTHPAGGSVRVYMLTHPSVKVMTGTQWRSTAGEAHKHTVAIDSTNDGLHGHAGETATAELPNHQHTVSKADGWDDETAPKHVSLNFIIRA